MEPGTPLRARLPGNVEHQLDDAAARSPLDKLVLVPPRVGHGASWAHWIAALRSQ